MVNPEEIKKEGVKLIEEFSEKLAGLPQSEETHYVVDLRNVTRPDGKSKKNKDFPKKLEKIVPRFEEGYVVTEKGV